MERLANAAKLSEEAHSQDVAALHAECRAAESDGWSVREIARKIKKSPAHTHRIMAGLTGARP